MTSWSTLGKVVRYHLIQWPAYLALPWAVTTFSLVVNIIISWQTPATHTGGLVALYIWMLGGGLLAISRSLPFGLALGLSRRSYYLGTVCLAFGLAAFDAVALTVLTVLERATGGWGVDLHFFRISYILDGVWYVIALTSFVGMVLLFGYGLWYGLVYRRWNLRGTVVFIGVQMTVALIAVLVAAWTDAWPALGRFFTDLSAVGLTGVFAVLAVVLFTGGFTTMRRVTV